MTVNNDVASAVGPAILWVPGAGTAYGGIKGYDYVGEFRDFTSEWRGTRGDGSSK